MDRTQKWKKQLQISEEAEKRSKEIGKELKSCDQENDKTPFDALYYKIFLLFLNHWMYFKLGVRALALFFAHSSDAAAIVMDGFSTDFSTS